MNDTQKMLQAIINGQSTLTQELLIKMDKIDKKVDGLEVKLDKVEENLTGRIDKLGKQLAYLEDDTPTREEFDNLEKSVDNVDNIEQKVSSAL